MVPETTWLLVTNPAPVNSTIGGEEVRGLIGHAAVRIPVDALAKAAEDFSGGLRKLFDRLAETVGAFELSEIEVSATVTISGELSLLGVGHGEAGGEGGMKLKFKRIHGGSQREHSAA